MLPHRLQTEWSGNVVNHFRKTPSKHQKGCKSATITRDSISKGNCVRKDWLTVSLDLWLCRCFTGGGSVEWGGLSAEVGSAFHRQWAAVGFWAFWKCVWESGGQRERENTLQFYARVKMQTRHEYRVLCPLAHSHRFKHLITMSVQVIHDCCDLSVYLGQAEGKKMAVLH